MCQVYHYLNEEGSLIKKRKEKAMHLAYKSRYISAIVNPRYWTLHCLHISLTLNCSQPEIPYYNWCNVTDVKMTADLEKTSCEAAIKHESSLH